MRVAVIGAGAVGGTIAALLDRGGHSVDVTARGEHLAAIAANGLRLSGAWGEHTARVHASSVLTRSPDLAIVTAKAHDAESALRANAAMIVGIPVVVVQNGLRSVIVAKRAAPRSDIVGGLALFAASLLSPGQVKVTTAGSTYLGGDLLPTLYASRVLGEVMPVTSTGNFEGAQWTKLIVNQVNALPAITGLSAQEVIADRALRAVMTESMREAVRVGIARGVEFEKLQGLSDRMLHLLVRLPASVGQALPLLMRARMGRTPNPGSTLQSIRRHQPTEIDYLNGAVVEAGTEVDVATPVNGLLVHMVHEVERTGEFIAPAEVAARIDRPAVIG
ncbi:2-dehydropantoate 2-reductase [Lacisediminihabitans sp.]|jgi:2-dehydropantoate 2-reductase|uniref:ketopantoate reductase family protein n=1 Tax=Lacisediminihabitans sp. TaxID=2787631 RepID=UPI002F939BA8